MSLCLRVTSPPPFPTRGSRPRCQHLINPLSNSSTRQPRGTHLQLCTYITYLGAIGGKAGGGFCTLSSQPAAHLETARRNKFVYYLRTSRSTSALQASTFQSPAWFLVPAGKKEVRHPILLHHGGGGGGSGRGIAAFRTFPFLSWASTYFHANQTGERFMRDKDTSYLNKSLIPH